ncbi:hypothetical protein [Devosia sp.]|uniref:hypothetical protein n=1 Tax=Devosia sp. TaxID=1871048 RepID=UPI0025BD6791|nr:hypothetical protein [Devosia sp.]
MLNGIDGHSQMGIANTSRHDRIAAMGLESSKSAKRLPELCDLATEGLRRMVFPDLRVAHTMRGIGTVNGSGTSAEGDNLRYAANVAQGLGWLDEEVQRDVLGGWSAIDLAINCIERANRSGEPGAVALAAWAAAETAGIFTPELFAILELALSSSTPIHTVPCAWALTAAIAARHLGDTSQVQAMATQKLRQAQSASGLFPHVLPSTSSSWLRRHVGSFADQVYPIQALSRLSAATGDQSALRAADACAARIVQLQGAAGQWWWHYDTRNGEVVEGYPVYSVHQHAMAPMALLDLLDAGGADYRGALALGLRWIDSRPETNEPIVSEADNVIWRKVGRSEPNKLARKVGAVTTAVKPGLHLPYLDAVLPADRIDRECRPYEFGWMLYAWRSRGVIDQLRQA